MTNSHKTPSDVNKVVLVDEYGTPTSSSGGVSQTDGSAFTPNTSSGTPAMGLYESTPTSVSDGDVGVAGMTADRRLKVLADLSAVDNAVLDAMVVDLAAIEALLITIDGVIDSILEAVQLTDNIVKLEDDAHQSGDAGVQMLGVRNDNLASTYAGASGDYSPIATDVRGQVYTGDNKLEDAAHSSGQTGSFVLAVRSDTPAVTGMTDGDYAALIVSSTGRLWSSATIDAALPAGTNAIGNVGVIPRTSGGMTIFRSIDLDETEEEVKATAGQVFSITAFNTTAAPLYLKFYNATAANVSVGTTTPVLTFVVPGNADSDGAGFVWNNPIGFAFGTAITVACTTGVADNDTGAPGANACLVNIGYA